jgi:energy-coupling factor transporter transmembrane protein EcfT
MKEFVLKQIFKSKKFWYAVGSIVIPLISNLFRSV